jgi:hypothetical protein
MAPAQWQWVNPFPSGNPITAMTWDGSRFVAFDASATVLTSPDAAIWSTTLTGLPDFVTALAWGNGTYVAAGAGFGGARILTSADAVTWTPHDIGVPVNHFAQALWNTDLGQFVLVADGGVILTSANGTEWTPQGSGTVNDLNDIAWNNGQYVVVGAFGTIITSNNGIDWTDHSLSSTDEPLLSVAASGNLYAIVRGSGPASDHSAVLTNNQPSKPANWHLAFGVVDPTAHSQLSRIVWDGNAFVTVGGIIATSIDGVVWTYVASQAFGSLDAVAFSGDSIVAADTFGTILVAPLDGLAWTPTSTDFITESLTSVVWNGSAFAAVGDLGSFISSSNGLDWDVNNFALPLSPQAMAWGNGTYVAVADGGIASSTDGGFTWTLSPDPALSSVTFRGVTWGDDQFVAVGAITVGTPPVASFLGVIYTSPDGANWTSRPSNAEVGDSVQAIVWAGDKFVAVGATATHDPFGDLVFGPPPVFLSPDGVTWTRTSPLHTVIGGTVLKSIAWNGSRFVAVGTPGFNFDPRSLATSPDGVQWEYVNPLPAVNNAGELDSVVWTGSKFVAVGGITAELSSSDGITWTAQSTGAGSLVSIASDGIQCVAVGDGGAIMRETSLCNADSLFKNGFDP